MADRTVTVRLKVNDEFSGSVNSYTQKMGQAEQATQRMNNAATQSRSAFSGMGTAITGAIAAFGVMGVARLGEELYSTGMNAQRAGALFASFGAQVGSTSTLLERLRGVTRGVVDDTTLMSAASTQLSMGLAKNADDVTRLTNIGVTFAQAMGTDIGASMENLNMILANQSYLRLDTLGISSSQVRELAAQYRSAGMDTSEAFNAAFLDVAEQKLPQMEKVADAMVSPFAQLQTQIDNIMADVANGFAQGVNTLIDIAQNGGVLIRAALFGEGSAQAGQAAANNPMIQSMAQLQGSQYAITQGYTSNSPQAQAMANNIASLLGHAQNTGVSIGDMSLEDVRAITAAGPFTLDSQIRQFRDWAAAAQAAGVQAGVWASQSAALNQQLAEQATAQERTWQTGLPENWFNQADGIGRGVQNANYRDWLMGTAQQFSGFTGTTLRNGRIGTDAQFFSDEDLTRAQSQLATINEMVDRAERWNEMTGQPMVSDTDLDAMRGMAEEARDWADQVARGSASMASLSDLLGQGQTGQFAEVNQAVMNEMRDRGASPDQIRAMEERGMSGLRVQFENEVVPQLTDVLEQLGPDWYGALEQAYLEYVRNIRTMNPDFDGPVPLDLITQSIGINQQQGSAYTVRPGDTVWGLAHAAGQSVEQYMAANGLDSSMLSIGQQIGSANQYTLNPGVIGIPNAADVGAETDRQAQVAADSYQYHLEGAFTSAVDTFTSLLNNAAAHVVQVPIEFVLLNGGAFNTLLAGAIATVTAANGGATPGATGNSGRSSSPRNSNSGAVNTANAIGGGI
jgi:LysM repeat protein